VIVFALTLAAFTTMYIARHQTGGKPLQEEPFHIVEAFVKASYARDYKQAYQQISSVDQRVMDERDYASQHRNLSGFALELAKKLAGDMDIWVIDRKLNLDQAHYSVGYKVRVYEEVPSPPADWDEDKLNALSRAEQERFVERLERFKINGNMITITGQETFDLALEQGRWKIFFDWASRTRIKFRVALSERAGLDARVLHNDFFAKQDEPFTIVFKIKNISNHQLVARIVHHVEPKDMEDHVDMIACGALRPLVLQPGEERELSSAYLLKDGARTGAPFGITYQFNVEALSSTPGPAPKTTATTRMPLKAAAPS
jgi:hypothetical protein